MPDNDKEILEENLEDVEETVEETSEETAEADVDNTSSEADKVENGEEEKESKSFAEKMADKKKAKADKKNDAKCEAMQAKIDELEDRVKRQMAEFENFRKRTDKEKAMMFETGAKSVIEKILPVVDNFERGLATIPEDDENSPFANGMKMIYKQMMDELEKLGVKPIEAVGQEFDPNFHNAVMQMESEEYESGVVAQEMLKGYTYHDTVVRHSMVAVVP